MSLEEGIMERSAGCLLNISSLPGEFGIGGFSNDAKYFVEQAVSMGFKWWQTLPITAIGAGDSPYSSISAFAGNYLYISPDQFDSSLLSREEIDSLKYHGEIYLTDYNHARWAKRKLLEYTFPRITPEIQREIDLFRKENAFWLDDYALFMTLKEKFGGKMWSEWDEPYRFRQPDTMEKVKEEYSSTINFYYYEQYEFFRQWKNIKDYANGYNLKIFGDIPIYVCYDSVDVWANPKLFQLDENLEMRSVAGVPPDYFAADGQLWGNPLYNYKEMAKDDYKWWVSRIVHNLKMYDMLRIDHFRGLYEYWAVPAESTTAQAGKWEKGPGMELWKALDKVVENPSIIAEDLGQIDEKIRKYLDESGFYGMRVMQFGFDGDTKNIHLPHNYPKNCVAYTATHDNDTTLGWLLSLDEHTRTLALDYVNCDSHMGWACGGAHCKATKAFIRTLMASVSDLVIVPLQDLCGYGSDTRMNVPGKPEGNWRYRTNYGAMENIDRDFVRQMIEIYGRATGW